MATNLQVRDPRARALAERIARAKRISMTDAVVGALEAEAKRLDERPLAERIAEIADEFQKMGKPGGHRMTKDEIDDMWWG